MKKNPPGKPKIKRKDKAYDLNQCVLYRLKSKGQLEKILCVQLKKLEEISCDTNYLLQTKKQLNGKIRNIQCPKPALYKVHTRIASLISRVETPYYLHSGVKKRSHITNANSHKGDHSILTLDIQDFYRSISKKSVYWFFYAKLKMSRDIAGLLADLCTYDGYIPTGSSLSMILAYWVSSDMFNQLDNFSINRNIIMTVYVDDLTFSGVNVDNKFKRGVIQLIKRCGYEVKSSKTRLFMSSVPKIVTGCVLKKSSVYVRNKQLYEINKLRNMIKEADSKAEVFNLIKKLSGHLLSAGQIDERYKEIEARLRGLA